MQSHRTGVIFTGHVIERTDFDDAGVVDQDVNPVEAIDDFPNSCLNLIAIEQIAFDGKKFAAACSQIGSCAGEFFWIARKENNASALIANVSRQHKAKSARSATDQGNFIAQRVLNRANDAGGYPTAEQKSACSEPNPSIHLHQATIRYETFGASGREQGATARHLLGQSRVFTIEARDFTCCLAINGALLQISTLVTRNLADPYADFGLHLPVFPIQL